MAIDSYEVGQKVVLVDEESYPQIWEVVGVGRNGWYQVQSNGPYCSFGMPAHSKEFRLANEDELHANQRL
ncbi:hypothetical protein [Acinetobacter baumannii]|uniref:hypothetical protein n=1 Tax=Acinetobacter baumannii TaxID=470 RepID=UPI000810F1F8|nr:hypothetical protein [Acinetobacter baumannii]MDC5598366.1 hypothetical protein [Acinetobacter baumannii]